MKSYRLLIYCLRSTFRACHDLVVWRWMTRKRVYNIMILRRRHFNRHNSRHWYVFNYGTSETFKLVRLFITKLHHFSSVLKINVSTPSFTFVMCRRSYKYGVCQSPLSQLVSGTYGIYTIHTCSYIVCRV